MSTLSRTPSLTPSPSRSPSPEPPVQPDHFYGAENIQLPPSPDSDGKTWLDPNDDPLAHRGIPVFKPTMEEFEDFESYMSKVECWGARSGIVKIVPPKEWTDALPPLKSQLASVKIKSPIEQHMLGRGGLFRQENIEKRKIFSVREWAELCGKDDFRAPGVGDVGLHARSTTIKPKTRKGRKKASDTVKAESAEPEPDGDEVEIKEEQVDDQEMSIDEHSGPGPLVVSPPNSVGAPATPAAIDADPDIADADAAETDNGSVQPVSTGDKQKVKAKRVGQTREAREASLADRAVRDTAFLDTFEPHSHWLPPNTKAVDYTPEFCQKLERQYWRNCGLGKPAWYGADTQGSLYTDATTSWNVAHLHSTLSRLLPVSNKGLPGVNTPYLYFGMWRATFAWHVEDMDLFSINYIHFGAPKFWYAVPQGRAGALEQTMRGYFPKDTSQCPQFLRHKSFLASPTLLAQSSCRPNYLVQHAGEFVVTFPRGYHAGFNLGFNCAESVNFALDSWLELGKRAKACECISDSVRIDVDQLLMDRAIEAASPRKPDHPKRSPKGQTDKAGKHRSSRKRKSEGGEDAPKPKKLKIKPSTIPSSTSVSSSSLSQPSSSKTVLPRLSITLKLGPRPAEPEPFPCCLCISMSREGLLRVHDPPIGRKDADDAAGSPKVWMAHEDCANVVPETWVDEVDRNGEESGGKEKVVFGVDGIVKDRWNLKCSACTKTRPKAHGAPIQCTKGKCPKAFHVSCARDGKESGIIFNILREVEKEVVLLDPGTSAPINPPLDQMQVDSAGQSEAVNVDGVPLNGSGSNTPDARVLKIIKKYEVQVLCTQHNPAIAAAKKAGKQDRIRNDLMGLPNMARIKIRVSAGVFEVSLIRVIEDTKSVEVLWDRGVKREFKWGSVVFGSTDGPVLQKPSEIAPETDQASASMPVVTFPSVSAATATAAQGPPHRAIPATSTTPVVPTSRSTSQTAPTPAITTLAQFPFPHRIPPAYDYWPYQGQGTQAQYASSTHPHAYGYSGYYRSGPTIAGPSPHYNAYAYAQNPYRGGMLHWQQPYQGPRPDYYRTGVGQLQGQPPLPQQTQTQLQTQQDQSLNLVAASKPAPSPTSSSHTSDPRFRGTSTLQPAAPASNAATPIPPTTSAPITDTQAPSSEGAQVVFKNLASLSTLQPTQIAGILRNNPELRDIVWAAVDKQKKEENTPS